MRDVLGFHLPQHSRGQKIFSIFPTILHLKNAISVITYLGTNEPTSSNNAISGNGS